MVLIPTALASLGAWDETCSLHWFLHLSILPVSSLFFRFRK